MKNSFYLLLALVCLISCQKKGNFQVVEIPNEISLDLEREAMETYLSLPNATHSYVQQLPVYLTLLGLRPAPVDDIKATIGRVLFYDKNLSVDRSVSCASCHKQEFAFSDNQKFSKGAFGQLTTRNTPPLGNVSSVSAHYASIKGKPAPHFFWDNRAATVAEQSLQTIENPLEMGLPLVEAAARIGELKYYGKLWREVFGHFSPQKEEVLACLDQFVGSMGVHKSKLDYGIESLKIAELVASNAVISVTVSIDTAILQGYYGPDITIITSTNDTIITGDLIEMPGYSLQELRGRDLFVGNCTNCHSPLRTFQDVMETCNGLDLNYADSGIGKLTGDPSKNGVFKSPSLRNIALTSPYMHDGRFIMLRQVVDFYADGVQLHPNLHPSLLQPNGSTKLNFSESDRVALVAFLNTLTDESVKTNKRFSDPFKH